MVPLSCTEPDYFRHRHFCSFWYRTDRIPDTPTFQHFKKEVHPARPYRWLWKWLHPACPFCWLWKGPHPARPYCWRWKGTHPPRLYCWLWKVYSLQVHAVGCGNGYTMENRIFAVSSPSNTRQNQFMLLSLILEEESGTPCTCILLAVETDISCSSILLEVERDIPFLLVVSCLSPASLSRHLGSVRYCWSRVSPTLPSFAQNEKTA